MQFWKTGRLGFFYRADKQATADRAVQVHRASLFWFPRRPPFLPKLSERRTLVTLEPVDAPAVPPVAPPTAAGSSSAIDDMSNTCTGAGSASTSAGTLS